MGKRLLFELFPGTTLIIFQHEPITFLAMGSIIASMVERELPTVGSLCVKWSDEVLISQGTNQCLQLHPHTHTLGHDS